MPDKKNKFPTRDIVVGLLATIISSYTTCHIQSVKLSEEYKQKMYAIDAEHQKLMLERIDHAVAVNRELNKSAERKYYTIQFKNECNQSLNVALAYRALDDSWVVRGWLTVPQGETHTLADSVTTGHVFYYYGASKDHVWNGDRLYMVSNGRFMYIEDSYFDLGWYKLPGASRQVEFVRRTIPNDFPFGAFTVALDCSNKQTSGK